MKNGNNLEFCEQMETLATKCRVSNTELARNYVACQTCAAYIKFIYAACPIVVKKTLLSSNKVTDKWCTVTDFYPGYTIDRDALDSVERYIQNPANCHLSDGTVQSIYKLMSSLSKMAHDLVV